MNMREEQLPVVCWEELLPLHFQERLAQRPLVYLPLGLCEPHGQVAALGLDTIKAEHLCRRAARQYGGIVAPTLGYQMHETGFHAPWLEREIGANKAAMTAIPPHVLLHFFLYQLRSFHNAGFSAAFVLTGHAGGNEHDLRRVAALVEAHWGLRVLVFTDGELVAGRFTGDHAGKYELSQLMAIRPELVRPELAARADEPNSGGRLALGRDALEASAAFGQAALEAALARIGELVTELSTVMRPLDTGARVSIAEAEALWHTLWSERSEWRTARLYEGQSPAPVESQWQTDEAPYKSDN